VLGQGKSERALGRLRTPGPRCVWKIRSGWAAGVSCIALAGAIVASGCGGTVAKTAAASEGSAPSPSTSLSVVTAAPASTPINVNITEKDFAIEAPNAEASAGLVDFHVSDNGPTAHEFLIFQTDLTPDKFPMKDGRVDEAGDGVAKVFDSGANIDVNSSKTFHAALTQGSYYLVCNLPGHFLAGMHTAFTVKPAAAAPLAIRTTEKDFAIVPAATTAKAGLVDFTVANTGPSPHEFLIFQTDLGAEKLPLGTDGRVNEDAAGISKVFDSGTNIDVNGSKSFHTALMAGNYVLVCNLPGGHYMAGMHTAFTVN
jgi:uncharacterized cupredoxin-like copper-binding protein